MKKNKIFSFTFGLLFISLIIFSGCSNSEQKIDNGVIIVGNDSDEHGCKASAGYSWDEEKGECVRPWEENKVESEIPKTCTSWYDGCNTCFVKDGKIGGCTMMYCEKTQEPKCLKYEEIQTVEIVLTEEDCLKNNGRVSGDMICEFKKPKVFGEGETIPQDYANGNLLIHNVTKEVCEANNGHKTIDGNGIEFCFIPLDNLPKIIDRGNLAQKAGVGDMCGGIAGIVCEQGLNCKLEGDYPDASGVCEKITPKICTMEYAPVCGIDGKTYGNKCMADNVEIAYDGECGQENSMNQPPRKCTREYNPQCGADGVTYSNPCTAGAMTISHAGACE